MACMRRRARALPRVVRLATTRTKPALEALEDAALVVRGAVLDDARARAWTAATKAAQGKWTADFGGEQFSLGRAFYTHLETGQAARYFADAATSDALVERTLPGMQAWARALFGELVGGVARPRLGFCGAGVHVFPAGGKVARSGGVPHWDVEGLAPLALERRARAVTLVVMLQRSLRGGGLRVWDALYDGGDEPDEDALATSARTHRYEVGEAVLMSSYRLHQIRPFGGPLDRISLTLHGVEIDRQVWDTWF